MNKYEGYMKKYEGYMKKYVVNMFQYLDGSGTWKSEAPGVRVISYSFLLIHRLEYLKKSRASSPLLDTEEREASRRTSFSFCIKALETRKNYNLSFSMVFAFKN